MFAKKQPRGHKDADINLKDVRNGWQVLAEIVTRPRIFIPVLIAAVVLIMFFSVGFYTDNHGVFHIGKRQQLQNLSKFGSQFLKKAEEDKKSETEERRTSR